MTMAAVINQRRYEFFRWRCELSLPRKLALSLGAACIIGLLAQVRIPLPWSPVPVTGQTFAVLLAAVMLGRWWGGVSVALYAGLGIAGVPWFTGWGSGLSHLAGPTGGYIIGFMLAALFLGHFTDKYIRARSFGSLLGLMLFAGLMLVYVPGLIQLGLWLNLIKGTPVTLSSLLTMGALPFIAGDITKTIIAAVIARGMTTRAAYNREADR